MRLLLVTHYYADHRGGVEIIAGEVAARLAGDAITIEWAASGPAPTTLPSQVTALPMAACNFTEDHLGFPYPIWGPISLWRLLRAVRRADVVHLHDCLYMGNVWAYLAARALGKPVVVTQHIGVVPYRSRVLRALHHTANAILGRLVLGGCQQVVYYSDLARKYFDPFVRYRRAPIWIANGVATDRFQPLADAERAALRARLGLPADRLVLLFVGRFVEKKGLRVLEQLARRHPEFHWVFVGWGPEDPAHWNLPQVDCRGSQQTHQIAPFYQSADLLVLPSVGEGFPLVIQEAMACGTPALISTDTAAGSPGVEQVCLALPLNLPRWHDQLQALLDHPEQLSALRPQVAEYAQREWNWGACAARYREIFERLTDKSGA